MLPLWRLSDVYLSHRWYKTLMVKKDFNGESPRKYVHATDVASLIQPPLPPGSMVRNRIVLFLQRGFRMNSILCHGLIITKHIRRAGNCGSLLCIVTLTVPLNWSTITKQLEPSLRSPRDSVTCVIGINKTVSGDNITWWFWRVPWNWFLCSFVKLCQSWL